MTVEREPLRRIPQDKPIRAGKVSFDFKFVWVAGLTTISLVTIILTSLLGSWYIGVGVAVLAAAFYIFFIGAVTLDEEQPIPLARISRVWLQKHRNRKGTNVYSSEQPEIGEVLGSRRNERDKLKPIKQIGRVDFSPYMVSGQPLGIAHDFRDETYAATLWAVGSSILSASSGSRRDLLSGFGALLDAVSRSRGAIHRISWRCQTIIGESINSQEMIEAVRGGAGLTRKNPPNHDVLMRRMDEMARRSVRHHNTFTISINTRLKSQIKAAGGPERYLVSQLRTFLALAMGSEAGFSPVGLKEVAFHSYNNLLLENLMALDPVFAQPIWEEWLTVTDPLSEFAAWPRTADFTNSDFCKIGQTYHCGYYIGEFTREGMMADQFWNILKLDVPKTVTAIFAMTEPGWARKRAVLQASGVTGVNKDRASVGRRVSSFDEEEQHAALIHEQEMARSEGQDGRLRLYIDLSAANLEELRVNESRLLNAGKDSSFLLYPFTDRQHLGINAVLPLGRGLKTVPVPSKIQRLFK